MTDRQDPATSGTVRCCADLASCVDPGAMMQFLAPDASNKLLGNIDQQVQHAKLIGELMEVHSKLLTERGKKMQQQSFRVADLLASLANMTKVQEDLRTYLVDAAQRQVLFLNVLRQRGNNFIAHEAAGAPPVLVYKYDMLIDGRTLRRPVNYALVRIVPPAGHKIDPEKRPYLIIDPRAGHGAGIGGFKEESEVGVALRGGHPVYFVIFFPIPEEGQTLVDVCAAEGEFLAKVCELHPKSPRPVVMGNCQGGWAAMLLAASNPDICGPVVMNGAPLSYWAGANGKNPMRYSGGLFGGALPALMLADLGGGKFDGANLVQNFESLNPSRNYFRKYYDIYAKVDTEENRFLEFERWWGGFYIMNESEIRWIVDNLFIGNKLARGTAMLSPGQHIDLREVKAPIIIFASQGDNITPPQQALNWIADAYHDVHEIRARGNRIIYTLDEEVGHLGIFVSAKVAQKQHKEIVTALQMIESLAPGLYEMVIANKEGEGPNAQYTVAFEGRTIDDILKLDDGRDDEREFAPVARLSELSEEIYDLTIRPFIKAMVTPQVAAAHMFMQPLRFRRYMMSDKTPGLAALGPVADMVKADRHPVPSDNLFLKFERLWADEVESFLDFYRDSRDTFYELLFHSVYGSPAMMALGERTLAKSAVAEVNLRRLPDVRAALARLAEGGYAEGVIRILILLARARGSVRRSRLERSNAILHSSEPFVSMSDEVRSRIIHEQSLICDFERDRAVVALPKLLPDTADRQKAMALVQRIIGPTAEMDAPTLAMYQKIRGALGIEQPAAVAAE